MRILPYPDKNLPVYTSFTNPLPSLILALHETPQIHSIKMSSLHFKAGYPVPGLVCILIASRFWMCATGAESPLPNLIKNPGFTAPAADGHFPGGYDLAGNVEFRYMGDKVRDMAGWGVALQSGKYLMGSSSLAGSVSQKVTGLDAKAGRWFRFSFRGLPQDNFAVDQDDLKMNVAFFGNGGAISYDVKAKYLYPIIQQARHDLTVNGVRHSGGAAVWRNYVMEFRVPFPQVDEVRLSVEFGHGIQRTAANTEFFVTDFSLVQIPDPAGAATPATSVATAHAESLPHGKTIPLGGRWYYDSSANETTAPAVFDYTNADRLLYRDSTWSAPFSGNMTAVLRAGQKDRAGNIMKEDRIVIDNVTVRFDGASMIIHTKGIPNHPTGRFPEEGFGRNPSYIQEQDSTYYIPLDPKVNPSHFVTTLNNSNHALPMGPIGIAVNGVVFFNPFDMGNTDATDLMDLCCGHPNQDNQYHYHKYPICVNSPWSDEGTDHSPLIGWAFDGFPIYGPYESNGIMAKDVKGTGALNAFNMHYDEARGWHYHVTPGKFPYIIGGYWGTEDPRDSHHGPPRGGGGPGGPFPGGRPPPPPWGGGFPPPPPP